jgi:hypothetical protein
MDMWRKLLTGRLDLCLAVGIATSGCTSVSQQLQPQPSLATPATSSFDGRYEASVRLTGVSGAMKRRNCETPSRTTINVRNGQFSLPLPHPDAVATDPSLADKATPVYNATIRPDGVITGFGDDTNTTLEGRVSGRHMSGQIYGLLCYYEFIADRV